MPPVASNCRLQVSIQNRAKLVAGINLKQNKVGCRLAYANTGRLREGVLPIPLGDLALVNVAELQEVRWPVVLMVEVPGRA